MTPEYAAPEQFERGPVTTQTDVYQLGVLLHPLLAGTAPAAPDRDADGRWRAPPQLDRCLREAQGSEPPLLRRIADERGVAAAALLRTLRGDLDRIVRRAMHPDPARRYAGVGALADDLKRWLRGEPISARLDSLAYRAACFLRRHRWAVAGAAFAVVSLAAGLGLALHEASQARAAEHATERALVLLEDLFVGADPYAMRGIDTRVVDALAQARERIAAESVDDPAMAARLLANVGAIYVSLSDRESAGAALRDALAAARRAGPIAAAYGATAQARLAHYALVLDGKPEALPDLQAAIATLRAVRPEARRELAMALDLYADYLFNSGQYDAIPAVADEPLAGVAATRGNDSTDYAVALANRASLLRATGHSADALASAEHAYRISMHHGDLTPTGINLYVQQQYAGALNDLGRAGEAEPVLRKTLDTATKYVGVDSMLVQGLRWELANVDLVVGKFSDARDQLLDLRKRMGEQRNANYAAVLNALANAPLAAGNATDAIAPLEEAVDILCADEPAAPPCLAVRLNRLEARIANGVDVNDELTALDRDIAATPSNARLRLARLSARWMRRQGALTEAALSLQYAKDHVAALQAPPTERAHVLSESAALEEAQGHSAAALRDYQQADELMRQSWQVVPPAQLAVRARIAELTAAAQ